MRKFAVLATICFVLSGCQITGKREAEDQAQFDEAVKAQRKDIANVCKRLPEVQRHYCEQ